MSKKIFINGSMITKQPTGVGIHNINLLKHLIPKLVSENIEFIVYAYEPSLIINFLPLDFVRKISLGWLLDTLLLRFKSVHRLIWNFFFLDNLSKNFDIIYGLSTYGSVNNNKQIITVHDLICLNFPRQHFFQYLYFRLFVKHILKNCKKVIAISKFTKDEIINFYPFVVPNKIEVIYNGVDHMVDNSTIESDSYVREFTGCNRFCFSVGCSYAHKNCGLILAVAEKTKEENLLFVISGKQSRYFLKLRKIAKKNKLNKVLFIDYLTDSQLSSFYKLASLHIYLSKYEGFGFPPAEASFFGTNSLMIDNEVNKEIYQNIFPMTSSESIPNLLEKIILSINIMTDTNSHLKDLSANYNWEEVSDKIKANLN